MMFCIHGGEEVGGGFVVRFFLPTAPMHKQTVAEAAEHSGNTHGRGKADPAQIIEMRDVQALVQTIFDAPGAAVFLEPLAGVELSGKETGHQGHGFGAMMAQVSAEQGHLFHAGKIHLFGGGGERAEGACFKLALVELTAARQVGGEILREKRSRAGPRRGFRYWFGQSAGCF